MVVGPMPIYNRVVNNSDPSTSDPRLQHSWGVPPAVLGTVCGAISAIAYTAANICLRDAAETCDPVWVSFVKAVPTTVVAGIWLQIGMLRGQPVWPARNVLVSLLLAGLLGQLGGNVLFQLAVETLDKKLTKGRDLLGPLSEWWQVNLHHI